MLGYSERNNMYEIITKREFDVAKEYARIWKLFNSGDRVGLRAMSLSDEIDGNIQFFPDRFKSRALSLADFNDIYGFKFPAPNELVTINDLISYCEYVITLCNFLWEYADFSLDDDAEYLRDNLYNTVESCMDELGLVTASKGGIVIYVDKDPAVFAVSEVVTPELSTTILEYNHRRLKGDTKQKRMLLKIMADDFESKRNQLKSINGSVEGQLGQLLNKFIRHDHSMTPYISTLSNEQLEEIYDDIYRLYLLGNLQLDNLDRKKRMATVLNAINGS